jgi:hypothetical protein
MKRIFGLVFLISSYCVNAQKKDTSYSQLFSDVRKTIVLDLYIRQFVEKEQYFRVFSFDRSIEELEANEKNLKKFNIVVKAIKIDSIENCYYCDKFTALYKIYYALKKYDTLLSLPYDSARVSLALKELLSLSKLPESDAKLNFQVDHLIENLMIYKDLLINTKKIITVLKSGGTDFNALDGENLLYKSINIIASKNNLNSNLMNKIKDKDFVFLRSELENFRFNKLIYNPENLIQE